MMVLKTIRVLVVCLLLLSVSLTARTPTLAQGDEPSGLVEKMPFLLGYERPMSYLILIQITDELRPSGGFIRAIIHVKLENGQPTYFATHDIQDLEPQASGAYSWVNTGERILPPLPIENYMGLGNWVIRDANWWGDFRDSAAEILHFWTLAGFEPVDGIIAVNDHSLAAAIDIIGGLTMTDGTRLDSSNFKDYVIAHFYQGSGGQRLQNQRLMSSALTDAFMNSTRSISRLRLPLMMSQLYAQLETHDVMVVVFDPEIGAMLHEMGFDGALHADQADDYFYLVESNISYSKASPFIRHDMTYTASLAEDGTVISQLDITVSNHYARDLRLAFPEFFYEGSRWNDETRQFYANEGYYGGYTRVYLPENVRVLASTGFDSNTHFPTDPSPLKVVGGYVGLEAGEQQALQIRWVQPNLTLDEPFSLYVQRQPGLPTGKLVIRNCETVLAETVLDRDQTFMIDMAEESCHIAS